jgi:hypothetical protein
MTIKDYISKIDELSDDVTVFAKRINDQFIIDSEAVLLELTEDEESLPTKDISLLKCPGFDYFLEVAIIKEVLEDFTEEKPKANLKQKAERIVYYAEFDA